MHSNFLYQFHTYILSFFVLVSYFLDKYSIFIYNKLFFKKNLTILVIVRLT